MKAMADQLLRPTVFGNPLLREKAKRLGKSDIVSEDIQQLIADMKHTLEKKKYGVGLAAPQVGQGVALSVIGIKATPSRPDAEPFSTVIINPEVVETFGKRTGMWEGCISCGTGNSTLYGKVPRYRKVRLKWFDEAARQHERTFEGLAAHVIQHEVDHLNGVLFVDRVRDTKTYMMAGEYRKRIVRPALKKRKRLEHAKVKKYES